MGLLESLSTSNTVQVQVHYISCRHTGTFHSSCISGEKVPNTPWMGASMGNGDGLDVVMARKLLPLLGNKLWPSSHRWAIK
jgi:hypothetical protein